MSAPAALLESLERWGVLRSASVEAALRRVDVYSTFAHVPGRDGFCFAPERLPDGSFDLSPRVAVLLAELLEVRPGLRVALPMPRPRLLTALVKELGAQVYDGLKDRAADRTLEIAPARRLVPLSKDGFALEVSFEPNEETIVKRVGGAEGVRMGLDRVALHPGREPARPLRHVLVVEGFCRRLLLAKPQTRQDEAFAETIAHSWNPRVPKADPEGLRWAQRWFALAVVHQFSADLVDAAGLYRASVDAQPTSEAHTFLGWVLAMGSDYEGAIQECRNAIATDPSFGNPYNDIGAYLLELGRAEEALEWFPKALAAARYDAPHFAHCNEGRALLAVGRTEEARRAFERALDAQPDYAPAREFLSRLRTGA